MNGNKPKRISFPEIREIVKSYAGESPAPYITGGIGMFRAGIHAISDIIRPGSPYIIEECRLALVKRGTVRITINMMEHEVGENTLVFFGTGCIVQPHDLSPDVEVCGMMLSNERVGVAIGGSIPAALAGNGTFFVMEATKEEASIADNMFGIIWELIHQPAFPDDTVNGLIHSLLYYYEHIGKRQMSVDTSGKGRERQLFGQFIRLINTHCRKEHSLRFYADRLCITPRYLGVVVKNVSGITAKEWLDRAIATTAKVMLRHSDAKPIGDIADELNFPNPSFFCKFFRRMTGVTPQQYRHNGDCTIPLTE